LHLISIHYSAEALPFARAKIKGDPNHPSLSGIINFYPFRCGTVVIAELWELPYDPAPCAANICAMHIHDGNSCMSNKDMGFSNAMGHFNPGNCSHPAHAGDLPPLFSNKGYAWSAFYTECFTPMDILGKTVIIHAERDDFTTQPAGDSGARIGCGVILRTR